MELPFNVLWNLQRKINGRKGTQNDIGTFKMSPICICYSKVDKRFKTPKYYG